MAHDDRLASLVDDKAAARPHRKTGPKNPTMNGPLYMQASGSNVILVRRVKRKNESLWKQLARWAVENQIGTCDSRTRIPSFPSPPPAEEETGIVVGTGPEPTPRPAASRGTVPWLTG